MFSQNSLFNPTQSLKDVKATLKKMEGATPGVALGVDKPNKIGLSPLMVAASYGDNQFPLLKTLVRNGADINARSNDAVHYTPLHYACFYACPKNALYLIGKGANLIAYDTNINIALPIHYTVNFDPVQPEIFRKVIKAFADKGANLNLPDKRRGMPLLFWLIERNLTKMIDILFKDFGHFIDFDFRDHAGRTALDFAQKEPIFIQNLDTIRLLKSIKTKVLDASVNVNAYDKKGFTLTMKAALKGYDQRLAKLLAKGANVNTRDRAHMGNTALHWSCLYNQPKSAEMLMKNNADVLIKNNMGAQAINYVWGIMDRSKRKKVIDTLMKKGSSINHQTKKGDTVLTHLSFWGAHKMIKQFLKDFSDFINFKLKNKKGHTALDIAKRRQDKTLIDMLSPFYVRTPLANINQLNQKGYSPLMISALRGDLDEARYLVANGSNVNLKGRGGNTALHFALQYRNMNVAHFLLGCKGIEVNMKNDKGNTPLHEVVHLLTEKDRVKFTSELLKKGANINEKNKRGQTVLQVAEEKRMPQFIEFLKRDIGKIMKKRINIILQKEG